MSGAPLPSAARSARHAVEESLARCAALEPEVGAWVSVDANGARLAAAEIDAAPPGSRGPLAGVPFGVKDIIDLSGFPTRAGAAVRAEVSPAQGDAAAVARLRAAGAVPIGKTVTTEFAMMDPAGTRNPYDPRHTPGGSSSGSAAAVAAGMVPLALGTQTAGSLCRPAAYCGVSAYKPTFGAVPVDGIVPLSPSFDTVGIMTRHVRDLRAAGEALTGAGLAPSAADGPVAVLPDRIYERSTASANAVHRRAAEALGQLGHEIVVRDCPVDLDQIVVDHRTIMAAEAFAAHGKLLASDGAILGPRFRDLLREGSGIGPAALREAHERIGAARERIWAAFRDVAGILLQPVPGPAPRGLSATGPTGYLIPWTAFAGPLVVVPATLDADGLPLAVMMAAAPGHDAQALSVAERLAIRLDILPDRAPDRARLNAEALQ